MMLDIHPEPRNSLLEVWTEDSILVVGELSESHTTKRVLATRRVRAAIMEQGYFELEAERTFSFCYHFDSFDALSIYLEKAKWFDREGDALLIDRAEKIWQREKGQIVIREFLYASRLHRLD